MIAEDIFSIVLATALVCGLLVGAYWHAFRAGYRHARYLHDIAGNGAGDRVLRGYEPSPLLFEKNVDVVSTSPDLIP